MGLYEDMLAAKAEGRLKPFEEITEEELKQVWWDEKVSDQAIAELFGVPKSRIYRQRGKWGIKIHELNRKESLSIPLQIDDNIDKIAKAITNFAFRSGPVEGMHSKGKLSQDDMKTLNKFMVNRLAYVFGLLLQGKRALFDVLVNLEYMLVIDWDPAEPDDGDFVEVAKRLLSYDKRL